MNRLREWCQALWRPGRDTKDTPKHRYLYLLGSRSQRRRSRRLLRWPTLPYPNAAT